MVLAKAMNAIFPLFLKMAVDGITCDPTTTEICPDTAEIYLYVLLYGVIKFLGDFFN
jgi:hypothetical protein